MEISHSCPTTGRMIYQIDDEAIVTAIYDLIKAKLEEDYVLTPKE